MSRSIVGIIQARMGSTRLPGKSMMTLAGKPLIERVLERLSFVNEINNLVLAVPDTLEDKQLIKVASKMGIATFIGSEEDLVDRYYKAAIKFKADYIVRVPADNPVSHPTEIDRIIKHHISLQRPGFSSNLAEVFNSGYPDGIGAEIFDLELLEEVWIKESDLKKREHVHLNFFDYASQLQVNQDWCPISTIDSPLNWARPDIILDVNTQKQYDYMNELYSDLNDKNKLFTMSEIIPWHDARVRRVENHEL